MNNSKEIIIYSIIAAIIGVGAIMYKIKPTFTNTNTNTKDKQYEKQNLEENLYYYEPPIHVGGKRKRKSVKKCRKCNNKTKR